MKETLKEAIITSISEVLETMFFMSLEFNEPSALTDYINQAQDKLEACYLDFKGKLSGRFLFIVPHGILSAMTQSFMGQDASQIDVSHREGTIKEIVNMIAGNTFRHFDDESVFNLAIPEIIDLNKAIQIKSESEEINLIIETIDGHMALKITYTS
jgi:CheY-specific phosphatase CheX